MKVQINRDVCDAQLAFCEQCLGKFLKEPLGYERRCFIEFDDSDPETLTIELHSGENNVTLELNEEQRQLVAGEGWSYFTDFMPPIYRQKKPK